MKRLIVIIMLLLTLTGCSLLGQKPKTEVLDLDMVIQYQFTLADPDYSETTIYVDTPEYIRQMNEFLGQTVTVTHSDTPCACEYLDSVKIFLANGEELFFGIDKKSDGSFDFSEYSLSVISFSDKRYEDLINLVNSFGSDLSDPVAPTGMTVDDALAIYYSWFDGRADDPTPLNAQPLAMYEFEGEDYYWFAAEEPHMYWHNILINTQTGELLFMMTPDGENPVTTIQTLEDWCENGFNEATAVAVPYPG